MSADYVIAGLPSIPFDGPAPITPEALIELVHAQMGQDDADGIAALLKGGDTNHPLTLAWRDLDTQFRNTIAAERARKLDADASKWTRMTTGVSVFWNERISAAFQEKDPLKREALIDRVRFDAAEELVPVGAPLSKGAVFAYAVRLLVAMKREKISIEAGNGVFDRFADAEKQVSKE